MMRTIGSMVETVLEFVTFLWRGRLLWLIPLFFILVIFAGLVVLGQASSIAPFIYTLF